MGFFGFPGKSNGVKPPERYSYRDENGNLYYETAPGGVKVTPAGDIPWQEYNEAVRNHTASKYYKTDSPDFELRQAPKKPVPCEIRGNDGSGPGRRFEAAMSTFGTSNVDYFFDAFAPEMAQGAKDAGFYSKKASQGIDKLVDIATKQMSALKEENDKLKARVAELERAR